MRLSDLIVLAISMTMLDAQSIDEAGPELDLEYYSNLEVSDSDLNLDGKDHTYDANLFEGDIAGVNVEDMVNGTVAADENRNAIIDESQKWPGGVMPYVYWSGYTESQKAIIAKAISRLQEVTCLRMKQRTNEADYIYIKPVEGCFSKVGRIGGEQTLSLVNNCFYVGTVLHEIMHAAGFWHEQSRADRDDYVQVNWENIESDKLHNFNKYELGSEITHLDAEYDTCSLMHYSSTAFSKNGKPTLLKKQQGGCELGNKNDFSIIDVRKLNTLYECTGYPQVGCSDLYTDCQYLAVTKNYCKVSFASWMKENCCDSCQQQAMCRDNNAFCSSWASDGFCKGDYEGWMSENCCQSCQQQRQCQDEISRCDYYASQGFCDFGYITENCKRSCGNC